MIPFIRIVVAGLVAQLCLVGGLLGLASLAGGLNGWLDTLAAFAPIWLAVSLVGASLAWVLPRGARIAGLATALIGVLACLVLMVPEALRSTAPATPGAALGAPLKVLTFNVWDDNLNSMTTADAIIASGADVVAIQEGFGLSIWAQQRLAAAYPYPARCAAGCDLLLLSKHAWLGPTPSAAGSDVHGLAIWATTTAPDGRPVTILTTHYVWPIPPAGQARMRAQLPQIVATLPKSDLIVTGDFNLAPWTAALKTQDAALAPMIRRTRAVFTWPATIARLQLPSPLPILPIDQLYAGPNWKTLAVQRLPRAGSDHFGILVTLARP